jgi:hypothetical protein
MRLKLKRKRNRYIIEGTFCGSKAYWTSINTFTRSIALAKLWNEKQANAIIERYRRFGGIIKILVEKVDDNETN